jgi:hypothetical protein
MQIKYKIVEIHEQEHSIVVRYYSDLLPETELATHCDDFGNITRARTDVNIVLEVPPPVGAKLHSFIMKHCPMGLFETKEKVLNPNIDTSMNDIKPWFNVEVEQHIEKIGPTKSITRLIPGTTRIHGQPVELIVEEPTASIDDLLEKAKKIA